MYAFAYQLEKRDQKIIYIVSAVSKSDFEIHQHSMNTFRLMLRVKVYGCVGWNSFSQKWNLLKHSMYWFIENITWDINVQFIRFFIEIYVFINQKLVFLSVYLGAFNVSFVLAYCFSIYFIEKCKRRSKIYY